MVQRMKITRRKLMTRATLSSLAIVACRGGASPIDGALTPEMFGAKGDGVTNDTMAFRRLSEAVNAQGGGTVVFRPVVYRVGLQLGRRDRALFAPAPLLEFRNCKRALTLLGSGATLRCAPGLLYGTFHPSGAPFEHPMPFLEPGHTATPYTAMIRVEGCSESVEVTDITLDGGLASLRIGGRWGDVGWQIPATGLFLADNGGDVVIRNVVAKDHAQDGLQISGVEQPRPGTRRVLSDVRSEGNGRQACSFIGGSSYTFERCRFTGSARGRISSAPGAGVDLEAEGKKIRNLRFLACTFSGNGGVGMVSDSGDVANVTFERCEFSSDRDWVVWPNKPFFRFERCRFKGPVVRCYGHADVARATRFVDCRFSDMPQFDDHGSPKQLGPIANLSDSANVLFERCRFEVSHGAALPWSLQAIYQDCLMQQVSGPQGYPRGVYRGTNVINGDVDLYGSRITGSVTVNGIRRES